MPSWNEKPHVIPTINVNLTKCMQDCRVPWSPRGTTLPAHREGCPGIPVLIYCPIPRSMTVTVALGECCNSLECRRRTSEAGHSTDCPARPIRVACSISGETWEESEVTDVEVTTSIYLAGAAIEMAKQRWALVKALVLADSPTAEQYTRAPALWQQRDAVYAALARLRATEVAGDDAMAELERAGIHPRTWNKRENSEAALAAYVEHLVEQIGVLP